ncbi:hypothetical protein KEJ21_04400 [Candidatus Bathyarchaeota archaeon]|nr:hypothetical protein [Candidatus Bathyarchaeota archaeon]MBS7630347.1 hypothetical protein [Candidatus Bathyarchaeota archaeon]
MRPLASLIREMKRRISELEKRHRSIPFTVLETEFRRRPITLSLSEKSDELPKLFRGSFLHASVSEEDFIISNLPRIRFDSETFKKIEDVAYRMFDIEEVRDAPRIPHYKPDMFVEAGLEFVKHGRTVATLTPSKLYIDKEYDKAEDLAEALIKHVYSVEIKPSLLSKLIALIFRKFRKT